MSVEPPSSGRPTGPPSGPLSGPSQPPSGPPSQPPGSDGAHAPEPRGPWWRSVPRVAVLATVVVAAVVLAVVFTRSGGGGSAQGGEVFLQAAGKTGPDPFTESTAEDSSAPPVPTSPSAVSAPPNAVRGVEGGAPGLYGGTRKVSSCDVEQQVTALEADPAKNRAFASVAGVGPSEVPGYLRSLTPVQLRMDTRVTNHGYRDGNATAYQAVLQTGTAVLVDGRGVPRVRCACGNPLTTPIAQQTTPRHTGDSWPSYHPSNVVVVTPAPQVVDVFVLYDPDHDDWVARHRGDTGQKDKKTKPPARQPTPSVSVVTPVPPGSPSPCVSKSSAAPGTPIGPASPCPPTSDDPSSPPEDAEESSSEPPADRSDSEPPASEPPASEPPASEPPASEPPTSEPPSSPSSAPQLPPSSGTATMPLVPSTTLTGDPA
ncbi:DUF6777 domain-containing protein [Streptomyces sp. ALI-76-A]|uniref:DUF6777 domain-containing protein n=1 Tax=Streptomyces sp. ALI-76-A TaxID=3025736 RepID=UPI00256EB019|nr:DUF6777 domain-containing protein [Streptomyces sp. ALI-76-A]MDL5199463.1 hypothetical protein [Streptomyces sp. ALI-76-A]